MATTSDPIGSHDWHSGEYVEWWITSDVTHDDERRPLLRRVAQLLPPDTGHGIDVLDVGAGYAALSREVADERPDARLTLHDFSEPMFRWARERLEDVLDRVRFVKGDLRDPGWTAEVGGPFDAVVSSLAIHNVRDPARIRAIYAEIFPLVRPGGCFLNLDQAHASGPLSAAAQRISNDRYATAGPDDLASVPNQLRWLREAGFAEADCLHRAGFSTLFAGFRAP
jgi:tRNA (cmo5U34)-methyltransferase